MLKAISLCVLLLSAACGSQTDVMPKAALTSQSLTGCGDLCVANDTIHVTFPRIVSYNDDETLDLVFNAAAGSVTISTDIWGNFGGNPSAPIFPDGLQVGIGDTPYCLSHDREGDERGCESTCATIVETVEGENHVPLHLHQWNGTDGWSADTIDVDVTLL